VEGDRGRGEEGMTRKRKFGEIKSEMMLESRMGFVTDPDYHSMAWPVVDLTYRHDYPTVGEPRKAMIEFGTIHENGWLLERYVRAKQAAEAKDEWTRDMILCGAIKVVAMPGNEYGFPWQSEEVHDYMTIDWYEIP
jgi:hypothetical protein